MFLGKRRETMGDMSLQNKGLVLSYLQHLKTHFLFTHSYTHFPHLNISPFS